MKRLVLLALGMVLAAVCVQCTQSAPPAPAPETPRGDAAHGHALVQKMECARCHTVAVRTDVEEDALPREKQCTGCHAEILRGTVQGTPAQLARWKGRVAELSDVPSLSRTARFRREWLESFLLHPHDVRPGLAPTMPRLALSAADARDVATFLAPLDDDADDAVLAGAMPARGRELMEAKGCAACHVMTGVDPLRGMILPSDVQVADLPRARRMAPDLRFARQRLRARALVAWLRDPPLEKPDTLMPKVPLTDAEARDVAAYLVSVPLAPEEKREVPRRLPLLQREVRYDEVALKVLHKTCWHCHGEADFERGDGGPGNSGGFGFEGKGVNLSDYASTFAGARDERGQRTSLFAPTADGTPKLVAAMLARQREEAGEEGELRGMPLGLPAPTPEEVQLVETWIAQGRRR